MKIVIATRNMKKLKEMREILGGMDIEAVSEAEAGVDIEVEETGRTFEENARLKAAAVMEATGLPAVADDSGLEVTALGGRPGVFSARYGGVEDDAARNLLLLEEMDGESDRRAKFVSVVSCIFPDGREICVRGECSGELLCEQRGGGGFGYDPIFYLPGLGMTMAELSNDEKNRISHRAKALKKFQEALKSIYVD